MTNFKRSFFALIILILFSQSTFAKDDYDHNFSDTANTDWDLPVGFIFNKGIVEGYDDGTYRPFQTINRAELLKIILESIYEDIPNNAGANCGFYDVVPEEWYAKYVCFAKDEGIVKGYPDGSFQPSRAVNFVEALKITSLAYGWEVEESSDEWYKNYVEKAETQNLIPIYIQSFNEELKRGDMAEMITRFIKKEEKKLNEYLELIKATEVHVTYDCLQVTNCPVATDGSYDEEEEAYLSNFEIFQKNILDSGLHKEKIVFAVEENFAANHPEWKENAEEVIAYINEVLAKNTKLRLEIDKYMTFAEEDRYPEISTNPDYHILEEDYCSLTFAYYPYEELTPALREDERYSTVLFSEIEGKNCATVYVAEEIEYDELNGKKYFQDKLGFENNNSSSDLPDWEISYRSGLYTVLHEMGHGLGLASPEWYFYRFEDKTGEDPILEKYNFKEMFPNEMMGDSTSLDPEFSPLAAYIINHNLNHRFTVHEISSFFPEKVVVRVEDENGEAVSGADVKVYAGLKGCWYCNSEDSRYGLDEDGNNILLENLTADEDGEIEIDGPKNSWLFEETESTPYIGLIVKASDGNLEGAAYVTSFDMQQSKIMTGEDTYYVDVELE